MIEIDGLTKRYGDKTAVDGLSFVVEPGVVTGFLGPNGAGKSTTMRMIAGLDRPTSGTVRVNGKRYPGAAAPMAELGILLDARSVHPGLSARNNLLALARTAGIGRRRVDEVIELAGLAEVAGTRAGGFSLGMGQRLGVAAALLGRPSVQQRDRGHLVPVRGHRENPCRPDTRQARPARPRPGRRPRLRIQADKPRPAPAVISAVIRTACRGGADDRPEPRPARCGGRPGPRSTFRSIPRAPRRAP